MKYKFVKGGIGMEEALTMAGVFINTNGKWAWHRKASHTGGVPMGPPVFSVYETEDNFYSEELVNAILNGDKTQLTEEVRVMLEKSSKFYIDGKLI